MHSTITLRKTRFLAATAVSLMPCVVSVAYLVDQARSQQAVVPEFGGGWVWFAVGSLLLSIFVVWWKGVASLPLLVIIPILAFAGYQAASVSAVRARMQSANENKVERISVYSKIPGYTVWCNGIELGKTPLEMTIEDFNSKVPPTTQPPPQDSAIVDLAPQAANGSASDDQERLNFTNARWSAVPFDPLDFKSGATMFPSNARVMSFLQSKKYWWSFGLNEYTSRKRPFGYSISNGTLYVSAEDDGGVLKWHISLLRLLADHDGVDLQTAFADHIAEYSPPLQQALEADQQERDAPPSEPFVPTISLREHYSDTPLEFTEAVSRQDWIWVARSNDPRSAPLLTQWAETRRGRFGNNGSSFLTFEEDCILILIESELPEINAYLRDIMAEVNWTHGDLVRAFVGKQLKMGCDRNELSAWVAKIDDFHGGLQKEMLVTIAAPDFATYAQRFSMQEWARSFEGQRVAELKPPVIRWLTDQWQLAPDPMLVKILVKLETNVDVQEAVRSTDLGTLAKANPLIDATAYANLSDSFRNLLSEAAAREIKLATIPEHVTALADLLVVCSNETALTALESCSDGQKEHVAKALKTLQSQFEYRKKKQEERLQQARDLVAGRITPDDLISTRAFVWEDGAYKMVP